MGGEEGEGEGDSLSSAFITFASIYLGFVCGTQNAAKNRPPKLHCYNGLVHFVDCISSQG